MRRRRRPDPRHDIGCAFQVGPTCDCGNLPGPAPVLPTMLLKFYAGFPYEFQAEVTGHETTYRIIHHGEGEEETLEVPAETWERMLQGAKAENLRVVASYCMAHMQAHHDEDGEVVFDMSAGKEPS